MSPTSTRISWNSCSPGTRFEPAVGLQANHAEGVVSTIKNRCFIHFEKDINHINGIIFNMVSHHTLTMVNTITSKKYSVQSSRLCMQEATRISPTNIEIYKQQNLGLNMVSPSRLGVNLGYTSGSSLVKPGWFTKFGISAAETEVNQLVNGSLKMFKATYHCAWHRDTCIYI